MRVGTIITTVVPKTGGFVSACRHITEAPTIDFCSRNLRTWMEAAWCHGRLAQHQQQCDIPTRTFGTCRMNGLLDLGFQRTPSRSKRQLLSINAHRSLREDRPRGSSCNTTMEVGPKSRIIYGALIPWCYGWTRCEMQNTAQQSCW